MAIAEEALVQCPSCAAPTVAVARRGSEDGLSIRRRRQCSACTFLFTTVETVIVIKRAGVTEPFSRQAVIAGVRTAAQRQSFIADASAGRAQSRRRSRHAPLVCPRSEHLSTQSSWDSAESLFPLVAASGRG
ncbi:NrdR family transcriptional regulator [Streptomyces albiflavescens]|uniref:NrdR family transcriptional regulator n=1 Tax=Streptomyces albiflavescens TaxID=1623582 RepID=UPI0035709E84